MIDALQLDEAQGLTEATARAWMEARGWIFEAAKDGGTPWPSKGTKNLHSWQWNPSLFLKEVALIEGLSIQAMLREMNPRMQKGCPNKAARLAHPGFWLAKKEGDERGYLIKFDERRGDDDPGFEMFHAPYRDEWNRGCSYQVSNFKSGLAMWFFWPCDEHGNKIRWPERDGVPL